MSLVLTQWIISPLTCLSLFFFFCCQVLWRGTPTSCRLEAAIVWSCSGTSERHLCSRSAVSRATGRKSAGSSGARTTSCWLQVETITRWAEEGSYLFLRRLNWMNGEQPNVLHFPVSIATCVEPLKRAARAAIHRALGCSEGHRLVAPPARPAGLRWRHGWPLHPLLEHSDRPAAAVHRHRLSGLQPGLVQAHQWTGESSDADAVDVKENSCKGGGGKCSWFQICWWLKAQLGNY